MNLSSCTTITDSARSVRIDGNPPWPSGSAATASQLCITSGWVPVDGYEWEIRFYPPNQQYEYYMALELVFLSEPRGSRKVRANLSGRLVGPSGAGATQPYPEKTSPFKSFQHPLDSSGKFPVVSTYEACHASRLGHLTTNGGPLNVECTVTVFRDKDDVSDLQKDLGELLRSEAGADVTFVAPGSGKPIAAAHKAVLAARSPVFRAEFLGGMEEATSGRVEIEGVEAPVFRAMLRFIYTDAAPPELDDDDDEQQQQQAMAQHLLVAADRYGLDRLRTICESRIAQAIDANTVAATLALAEQLAYARLKARCTEFILGASPQVLGAVLATEGFKSLEENNPSMVTDLFKAAHGRIKKSW